MKVELIQYSVNPIETMATIASICYGREEASNPQRLVENLNKLGHHSVFEHIFYTFKIDDISRICLAQLTRHRHASYTVRSQRYCDESERDFIIPASLQLTFDEGQIEKLSNDIGNLYGWLLAQGVKREDARFILPQGSTTDLYMTLNLREFMHIYSLRNDKSSQWEIQELVNHMLKAVLEISPELEFLFK